MSTRLGRLGDAADADDTGAAGERTIAAGHIDDGPATLGEPPAPIQDHHLSTPATASGADWEFIWALVMVSVSAAPDGGSGHPRGERSWRGEECRRRYLRRHLLIQVQQPAPARWH